MRKFIILNDQELWKNNNIAAHKNSIKQSLS